MFRLIESRQERRCQRGATLFSVTAHTALIVAVVAGTAMGDEPRATDPAASPPFYIPTPADPTTSSAPAQPTTVPVPSPNAPIVTLPPLDIPTTIPPVGEPIPSDPFIGRVPTTRSDGPGPIPGSSGPTYRDSIAARADQVDRPAAPLARNRIPRYPDILQRARQEGSVLALFVVDSLGRVEPGSFRVAASTHALFAESVRHAVLAMRFRPAEVAGRPVRQLVEQRFLFSLSP